MSASASPRPASTSYPVAKGEDGAVDAAPSAGESASSVPSSNRASGSSRRCAMSPRGPFASAPGLSGGAEKIEPRGPSPRRARVDSNLRGPERWSRPEGFDAEMRSRGGVPRFPRRRRLCPRAPIATARKQHRLVARPQIPTPAGPRDRSANRVENRPSFLGSQKKDQTITRKQSHTKCHGNARRCSTQFGDNSQFLIRGNPLILFQRNPSMSKQQRLEVGGRRGRVVLPSHQLDFFRTVEMTSRRRLSLPRLVGPSPAPFPPPFFIFPVNPVDPACPFPGHSTVATSSTCASTSLSS